MTLGNFSINPLSLAVVKDFINDFLSKAGWEAVPWDTDAGNSRLSPSASFPPTYNTTRINLPLIFPSKITPPSGIPARFLPTGTQELLFGGSCIILLSHFSMSGICWLIDLRFECNRIHGVVLASAFIMARWLFHSHAQAPCWICIYQD